MGTTLDTLEDCTCGCLFYEDRGRAALALLDIASLLVRGERRSLAAGNPLDLRLLISIESESATTLAEALEPALAGETLVALGDVYVSSNFHFLRYWISQLRRVDRHSSWHERHLAVCRVLHGYPGWALPARRAAASLWATAGAYRNHRSLYLPDDFFSWSYEAQLAHFSSSRARALG